MSTPVLVFPIFPPLSLLLLLNPSGLLFLGWAVKDRVLKLLGITFLKAGEENVY
jgi:hypothetical protein